MESELKKLNFYSISQKTTPRNISFTQQKARVTFNKKIVPTRDTFSPSIKFQTKKDYDNSKQALIEIKQAKSRVQSFYDSVIEMQRERFKEQILESLDLSRKIALMPQIRITNVNKDLDLVKEMLHRRRSIQTDMGETPIKQSINTKFQYSPKIMIKKQTNSIKPQLNDRLIKFSNLQQMNESIFESKLKQGHQRSDRCNSSQNSHMITNIYDLKPLSPITKKQYSELQMYYNQLQKTNNNHDQFNKSFNQTQQVSNSSNKKAISRPSSTQQELILGKLTAVSQIKSTTVDLDIKYTNALNKIPLTKQSFLQFYTLKKLNNNEDQIIQAYTKMLQDPVTSHEVMECREGSQILKSDYDFNIYLFGGRNSHPMNKLEIYDPFHNQFKIPNKSQHSEIVIGRYNHSMVQYKNLLIVYGGQTLTSEKVQKAQCLKDIIQYDIDEKSWATRIQKTNQRYARRNHIAMVLSRFMLIFGGINDFNQQMNDLLVYDLERNDWIQGLHVDYRNVLPISHTKGIPIFYSSRNNIQCLDSLPDIDWGKALQLIKEEGFYFFGGQLQDGAASGDLWVIKSTRDGLKFVNGNKYTHGEQPQARYSHAMTYYEKENSLLIVGGRNDRAKIIYADAYFLRLDTLNWIRIYINNDGMIGRADHFIVQNGDSDFIILGGIDAQFQLSNKITIFSFNQDKLREYSKNENIRRYSSLEKDKKRSSKVSSSPNPKLKIKISGEEIIEDIHLNGAS